MANEKVVRVTKDDSTLTYKETAVEVNEYGSTHIMTNEKESLKTKALRAGDAITDLVDTAIDKTVDKVKTKTDELSKSGAFEPGYVAAKKDSADIAQLNPLVTELVKEFEDTITMIRKHSYEEQAEILTGYKKLLEEQINVIDSRINFVKRIR
jgi:leucyl aminopeptidase (aminopeptidase T)